MATINIKILGTNHQISCDDGQEGHLMNLAHNFNQRVLHLSTAYTKVSDALLLAMTGIMMEDEIAELANSANKTKIISQPTPPPDQFHKDYGDLSVIQTLDAITEYVESLAKKIEDTLL
jgi:cell division protein ZapA